MDPMEAILTELRSGGAHDSTGAFSIDLRHGLEKLRRYQLLDKNRYGLLLMAAAYRRGAPEVVIKNDADDFILSWPGEPLSQAELEDLFRLDGPMLPLGLALLNAQALRPRFIRVDSGPMRLELRRGSMRTLSIAPVPGVRVHVRERYSWRAFAKYAVEWLQLPPESALIARHCAGLGFPIVVNGRPLETRLEIGPAWLVLKLLGRTERRVPSALVTHRSSQVLEREIEADYSAIVVAGTHLQRRGLTVVTQGIRFLQPDTLSPDLFLATLLVLPDQRTDLSFARIQADEAFHAALASLNRALDEALLEALPTAPDQLLEPIAARFARRGQGAAWLTVQARRLTRGTGAGRTVLMRELGRQVPEVADLPAWQEALGGVLEELVQRRRQNIHSLSEVRGLAIELALLANLRPEPMLHRAIRLEQAFLQVALGALPEADSFLQEVGDHRLGLITLLRRRDPRWLPSTPLANALTALLQDRLGEARAHLAQAPRSLLVLDLMARVEALGGEWASAAKLNAQAMESSRGLHLRLRQLFGQALRARRLEHPIPPPAELPEQLELDRAERGIALWSRGDAPTMAHLQQAVLGVGDSETTRTATVQLGAAHPYTRAVAWTLGDRRLALGLRPEGFELMLLVELTALWSPEGFWP